MSFLDDVAAIFSSCTRGLLDKVKGEKTPPRADSGTMDTPAPLQDPFWPVRPSPRDEFESELRGPGPFDSK